METKKMSLANIKGKLSRSEMKNIMAGSGGTIGYMCCWTGTQSCSTCGTYGSCVPKADLRFC